MNVNTTLFKRKLKSLAALPSSFSMGDALSLKQVLDISTTFPSYKSTSEDALLYINTNQKTILFTQLNVYVKSELLSETLPIADFNLSDLSSVLAEDEMEILSQCFSEKKADSEISEPKSFESFVNLITKSLEKEKQNYDNPSLSFDGKYIEMLAHEVQEALVIVQELDKDDLFKNTLNQLFVDTVFALNDIKASDLLVADLIKVYKSVALTENDRSRIALVYFIERLQGNNISSAISVERLNKMVSNENFLKNIESLKASSAIPTLPTQADELILPHLLSKSAHPLSLKLANFIYRFASIIVKSDKVVDEKEKDALQLLLKKTTSPELTIEKTGLQVPKDDSLDKVLQELHSLIGMDKVKTSVTKHINLLKIQKMREKEGLESIKLNLHFVFMGPPGTGKTTVARLIGRIYKHLGYLSGGQLVEVDRSDLVAGYVGQTAIKTNKAIQESENGVLFIDEAYSLVPKDATNDFGSEAINTLLKAMEDKRDSFALIVAGYDEPMKQFIESNPGLRSRFNNFIYFEHFLPVELLKILERFGVENDFIFSDAAKQKLMDTFELLYKKRDESFGNARTVRNIFELCVQNQASRLLSLNPITKEMLQNIELEDVPAAKDILEQVLFKKITDEDLQFESVK